MVASLLNEIGVEMAACFAITCSCQCPPRNRLAFVVETGGTSTFHEDHCLLPTISCIRERTQHGICIYLDINRCQHFEELGVECRVQLRRSRVPGCAESPMPAEKLVSNVISDCVAAAVPRCAESHMTAWRDWKNIFATTSTLETSCHQRLSSRRNSDLTSWGWEACRQSPSVWRSSVSQVWSICALRLRSQAHRRRQCGGLHFSQWCVLSYQVVPITLILLLLPTSVATGPFVFGHSSPVDSCKPDYWTT